MIKPMLLPSTLLSLYKLSDFSFKSFFIAIPLFLLDDIEASTFGVIISFMSLFVFLVGFERYHDLARSTKLNNSVIYSSFLFYFCNQILLSPVFFFLLLFSGLSPLISIICIFIYIVESISSELYRIAFSTNNYLSYSLLSSLKSFVFYFFCLFYV